MRAHIYVRIYKTKKNEQRYLLVVREKGCKEHYIGLGPVSKEMAQIKRIQILNELIVGQYKKEPETYPYFDQFIEKFFTDFANVMRSKGNRWQRSVIILMINSGMRPGELSNFKWKDIDWEANRFAIVTDKTRKTKSGKTRYIPMNDILRR